MLQGCANQGLPLALLQAKGTVSTAGEDRPNPLQMHGLLVTWSGIRHSPLTSALMEALFVLSISTGISTARLDPSETIDVP
jgi:hypothetical protein